jgi:hypothetical protein
VSATICATKPKFLFSAPETKSPISDLLQPEYWHRPAALAQRTIRVNGVRELLRRFLRASVGDLVFMALPARDWLVGLKAQGVWT